MSKGTVIKNLTKEIHCNEKYPENMNVLITNKKSEDAIVYEGDMFSVDNKEQVLLRGLLSYKQTLEDLLDAGHTLKKSAKNRCKNIIHNLECITMDEHDILSLDEDEDNVESVNYTKRILTQMEDVIYNHRENIKDVQNLTKEVLTSLMFVSTMT